MDLTTCVNYISCAANNVTHCLSWGQNGLICYGACTSIAIVDSNFTRECGAVVNKLHGHTARVNSVRWIKGIKNEGETEMISTSSDRTSIVWRRIGDRYEFRDVVVLKGHNDAVTVGDACYDGHFGAKRMWAVTASSDSTIKIWNINLETDAAQCVQTVTLQRRFALDVKLRCIPITQNILLIWAGEDCKVHVHVLENGNFVPKIALGGHDDWVRAVEITETDDEGLMIASCAQDSTIRLWKVTLADDGIASETYNSAMEIPEIKLKKNAFQVTNDETTKRYDVRVCLDSVLSGHENWVYGLHWHPKIYSGEGMHQPLKLLSASTDKTMIMWEPEENTGIWVEKVRVGDIGGNNLGFFGCTFGANGRSILAYNFQGALQLWHFNQDAVKTGVIFGGHFKPVEDVRWEPDGEFVITVSLDQTARIHAPWVTGRDKVTWHELARPQIHGYDLNCVCVLDRYRFVSAADEKISRAFEAPQKFLDNFSRLCNVDTTSVLRQKDNARLPEGASVPALGLSNKAVYDCEPNLVVEQHPTDMYPESFFKPVSLTEPATEDVLLQNTLWPEVQKLYGHGYEVFRVASDESGGILATSCKATKPEDAAIFLWDTTTWTQIGSCAGHTLTVTRMEFSPCGGYLLSVSRDRTWCLFGKSGRDYELVAKSPKKGCHTRIIWACAWTHDSKFFVTGSRDKKAIMWANDNERLAVGPPLDASCAVTAVDIAPNFIFGKYFVGIGLESGNINLYTWCDSGGWSTCKTLSNTEAHGLSISQLRFRPKFGCAGQRDEEITGRVTLQMASCGMDHATRITTIVVNPQN